MVTKLFCWQTSKINRVDMVILILVAVIALIEKIKLSTSLFPNFNARE